MAIRRRSVLVGGAALWVGAPAILRAQPAAPARPAGAGPDKIHVGHGFAMHGEPKYKADAGPPDYLNPNAAQGRLRPAGRRGGTFDPLHPFIIKSVPAAGITSALGHAVLELARRGLDRIRPDRRDHRMAGGPRLGGLHAPAAGALARRQPDHGRGRDLLARHPEDQGPAELRLLLQRRGEGREGRRPQGACSPSATTPTRNCR